MPTRIVRGQWNGVEEVLQEVVVCRVIEQYISDQGDFFPALTGPYLVPSTFKRFKRQSTVTLELKSPPAPLVAILREELHRPNFRVVVYFPPQAPAACSTPPNSHPRVLPFFHSSPSFISIVIIHLLLEHGGHPAGSVEGVVLESGRVYQGVVRHRRGRPRLPTSVGGGGDLHLQGKSIAAF